MNSVEKSKNWKNKNSSKKSKKIHLNFVKHILFFAYILLLLFTQISVFAQSKSTKLSEEQILKKKEVLLQVLKFGTTKERAMALRELEGFPPEHSGILIDQLGKILDKDPDWMMRVYTIRTVATLKLTQYEESILKLLKTNNRTYKRIHLRH